MSMHIKFAIAVLSSSAIFSNALAQSAPTARDAVPEAMPFNIPYGPPITLDRAEAAIDAACTEAKKHNWALNVTVVDSGGNLLAFRRMDGALLAGIQVSEHKAKAALTYRRETKLFENAVQEGNLVALLTLDGLIALRGGIPLVEGGKMIGAIGCSGGTGSQDEVACKSGAATINK